jgi:tRNA(Arg) A34 adenosine deaminase TadA
LAIGVNKSRINNRWNPNLEGRPATEHAEMAALRQIDDAKGCILYVARSLKNGEPAMSKPCKNCEAEIKRRGIKKVVFTVDSYYDVED